MVFKISWRFFRCCFVKMPYTNKLSHSEFFKKRWLNPVSAASWKCWLNTISPRKTVVNLPTTVKRWYAQPHFFSTHAGRVFKLFDATPRGLRSFGSSVSPVYTFVVREKPWMPWKTRKSPGVSFASFVERGAGRFWWTDVWWDVGRLGSRIISAGLQSVIWMHIIGVIPGIWSLFSNCSPLMPNFQLRFSIGWALLGSPAIGPSFMIEYMRSCRSWWCYSCRRNMWGTMGKTPQFHSNLDHGEKID